MKSIIQNEKSCYICGSPYVEEHHIFGGNPNRKLSEKYGLKVWLCHEHHTGNTGVHFNADLMNEFHTLGQRAFERENPDKDFKEVFGKNYL